MYLYHTHPFISTTCSYTLDPLFIRVYPTRDLPLQSGPYAARVAGYQKKELSAVGHGVTMGDKSAIKQCTIGGYVCNVAVSYTLIYVYIYIYLRIVPYVCYVYFLLYIGSKCTIGARSKLNGCVVMSGVSIADGYYDNIYTCVWRIHVTCSTVHVYIYDMSYCFHCVPTLVIRIYISCVSVLYSYCYVCICI